MSDDFYVGYLPVPRRVKRIVFAGVGLILIGIIGAAIVIAGQQSDPGKGHWAMGEYDVYEGVLLEKPYAMLVVNGRPHLLVTEGKSVPMEQVKGLDGQRVRLRASILERDGRRMLAVPGGEDVIEVIGAAELNYELVSTNNSVELVGEIIDPKCYLGAMKPGGGKTHKACAALCLRGGIPPMLVERSADGTETYYLLVPDSENILDRVVDTVGEPVRVSGVRGMIGDLITLRIRPSSIERLSN